MMENSIDPTKVLQGHNGREQRFSIKRTLNISNPKTKKTMVERILEDDFADGTLVGNEYLHYQMTLSDGEVYDFAIYLSVSRFAKYGGRWTDKLVDDARTEAFQAFERTEDLIRIGKYVASNTN